MTFDFGAGTGFTVLFIASSLAINFYPGPNNLFSIANAARFGLAESLKASLGRQAAFALLILLLGIGLGALFVASPRVFLALKLIGAAFLLWLGVKLLLREPAPLAAADNGRVDRHERRRMLLDDFQIAFANPKPVLVMLPFLPQLVPAGHVASVKIFAAGALFLVLEAVAALAYALVGMRLTWLAQTLEGRRWLNRAGGAAVIAAAGLLLAAGA